MARRNLLTESGAPDAPRPAAIVSADDRVRARIENAIDTTGLRRPISSTTAVAVLARRWPTPLSLLSHGIFRVTNRATGEGATYRVEQQASNASFAPGKHVLSKLADGVEHPTNRDWRSFAFVDADAIVLWRSKVEKYTGHARLLSCVAGNRIDDRLRSGDYRAAAQADPWERPPNPVYVDRRSRIHTRAPVTFTRTESFEALALAVELGRDDARPILADAIAEGWPGPRKPPVHVFSAAALAALEGLPYCRRLTRFALGPPGATLFYRMKRVEVHGEIRYQLTREHGGGGRTSIAAIANGRSWARTVDLGIFFDLLRDPEPALVRYGRELSRCGRCGLQLTDPVSRQAGYGPECSQYLGIPRLSARAAVEVLASLDSLFPSLEG